MSGEKLLIPGELVRRLRSSKGVKQSVAAKKMDISQQAFSKLESAENISMPKLLLVLAALGSSLHEFETIKNLYPPPHFIT
jgi:transcriptional regulator with XRE-family HTH domain